MCCQGLQKHGMYDNSRDQLLNVGMKLYQRAVSGNMCAWEGVYGNMCA